MADKKTAPENTNLKPAADNAPEFPSAFSLFTPSWEAVKLNFGTFILLIVVIMAAVAGAVIVGLLLFALLKDSHVILYLLITLLSLALIGFMMVVSPAITFVQLKAAQKTKVDTDEAFEQGKKYVWRFLGLSVLVGLIVLGGLILFIVPGIFMIKRYLLSPYFLIDEDLAIGEAMKASAEASKKHGGAVWGLLGVEFLISLVNSIPYIGSAVGLVLNVAYYCAPAVRYEQIKAAG